MIGAGPAAVWRALAEVGRGPGRRARFQAASDSRAGGPLRAVGGAVAKTCQLRPERVQVASLRNSSPSRCAGWVKYLTDFTVVSRADGTALSTETRGVATDDSSRRKMQLYWRVIRAGRGPVRRDLLATVAARAELKRRPARGDEFSNSFASKSG